MRRRRRLTWALLLEVAVLAGCKGAPPAQVKPPAQQTLECDGQVGDSPAIRRLSQKELDNTFRDLLGDSSAPAAQFAPDPESYGYRNNSSALNVTQLLSTQMFSAVDDLTRATVDSRLGQVLTCDPSNVLDCSTAFIKSFGRRAYRRPLTESEVTAFSRLFLDQPKFNDGVRLVMQRMLMSPYFMYRTELGEPTATPTGDSHVVPLTQYELASRLSYFLLETMPDDELLDAAAAGQLATAEQLGTQARRLINQFTAHAAIDDFHDQWLGLSKILSVPKDNMRFPQFTDDVRASMYQEALRFVENAYWTGADARQLLTSTDTFLDDTLATYYGVPREPGGQFTHSPLPAGQQRAGLLSLGAVMATYSFAEEVSPVHRGKFVRNKLLCQELAPPPPSVMAKRPPLDPKLSLRERWEQHAKDAACAGCHQLTDPIGLGTANIDAIGHWQDRDGSQAIDASGEVVGLADGKFNGIAELGAKLAESPEVRDCMARQVMRFAFGRLEIPVDQCTVDGLAKKFAASGMALRELLVAVVQSDSFRYRPVVVPALSYGN